MERTIEFDLVRGDISQFSADVVALKYAQEFYGADEAVSSLLTEAGVSRESLRLEPGAYRLVETKGKIRAGKALFMGCVPLYTFDYAQIRRFSSDVLKVLAKNAPKTQSIAMTIHGPGYGLDEVEAARAQLGGYLDAIRRMQFPAVLERISIVERSTDRVERLREGLAGSLSEIDLASKSRDRWAYKLHVPAQKRKAPRKRKSPIAIQGVGKNSRLKPTIFVAMPFDPKFKDIFYIGIQESAHKSGFLCERIDHEHFTGEILERIKKKIEGAALVVAVLSDANPNVYLEVGYAWGKNRPTLLLARESKELRFDVQGQRCLMFESVYDLRRDLKRELRGLQEKGFLP